MGDKIKKEELFFSSTVDVLPYLKNIINYADPNNQQFNPRDFRILIQNVIESIFVNKEHLTDAWQQCLETHEELIKVRKQVKQDTEFTAEDRKNSFNNLKNIYLKLSKQPMPTPEKHSLPALELFQAEDKANQDNKKKVHFPDASTLSKLDTSAQSNYHPSMQPLKSTLKQPQSGPITEMELINIKNNIRANSIALRYHINALKQKLLSEFNEDSISLHFEYLKGVTQDLTNKILEIRKDALTVPEIQAIWDMKTITNSVNELQRYMDNEKNLIEKLPRLKELQNSIENCISTAEIKIKQPTPSSSSSANKPK